jgi:hypothetical protein
VTSETRRKIFHDAAASCAATSEAVLSEVMKESVERQSRKYFLHHAVGIPEAAISDEMISSWPRMMEFIQTPEQYARGFTSMIAYKLHTNPMMLAPFIAELVGPDMFFSQIEHKALAHARDNIFNVRDEADPVDGLSQRAPSSAEAIPPDATRH